MNKTKSKMETAEPIVAQEDATEIKGENKTLKIIHRVLLICLINVLYIVLEVYDLFKVTWLSATIFAVILVGIFAYSWLNRELTKFLTPIAFISISVVGGIFESAIAITVLFCILTVAYFILAFIRRDELDTLVMLISSGMSLFVLTALMQINKGLYVINSEANIAVFLWLFWAGASAVITIMKKEKFAITITYCISNILFSSIGVFFLPAGGNSNVFTLTCAVILLASSIISILLSYSKEQFNFGKFLGIISIILIGIVIFSYSFTISFNWLTSVQIKSVIVDYVLFVPLAIFSLVIFVLHNYKKAKIDDESRAIRYVENKQLLTIDWTLLGIYALFTIASFVMFLDHEEQNIAKAMTISLLFFGASMSLNIRITPIITLIATSSLFGAFLHVYNVMSENNILIILMVFASVLLIFSVINELFIKGEPVTTTLMMSGSLLLMTSSVIYFYLQTFALRYIMPGLVWAAVGLFLFTIGTIFNRIVLRRTGLIIILLDIVYTIIVVIVEYRGWQMGVAFIVLALVLLGCIYLFRWSEKRAQNLKVAEEETLVK